MKIIEANTLQIEVTTETITIMREHTMSTVQEVLIRNKHDTEMLSKHTSELLEESRRQRLRHAFDTNDMMYINSVFENVSMFELIKAILSHKSKKQ